MAQINQTKLEQVVDYLLNEMEPTVKGICKAGKLNTRAQSWRQYLKAAHELHPEEIAAELESEVVEKDDEDEVTTETPASAKEDAQDAELLCPENKTGDECCDDPEKCTKDTTSAPMFDITILKVSMTNDKGMNVDLAVKFYNGKRLVLEEAKDEIVKVIVGKNEVEINITELERDGKLDEVAFYRSKAV